MTCSARHGRSRRLATTLLGCTVLTVAGVGLTLVSGAQAGGTAGRPGFVPPTGRHPGLTPAQRAEFPAPGRVGPGTVSVLQVPAPDAPGRERTVWVYRPGVPDSPALPVLYFLHGLPGSAFDLASTGIVARLDDLFTHGLARPFVVVAPDGSSTGAADPEWADSTDGSVQLESFVTGPLITAVEGGNRRDRDHRAIAGFSMGGYGAMNLALRHPDLYGQVVSIAGYFGLDDESGIFATPEDRQANRPDAHVGQAARLRVMLVDGTHDTEPVVVGETQRFAALLRSAGQDPVVVTPDAGHSLDLVRRATQPMIDFLEQGWPG